MNECIGLAVISLDEPKALHRIEELDRPLRFFAGQLPLRAALGALDGHRLTVDPQVRRRDLAAAIDERELQRLPVGKIGKSCLLDRGNVNEHVVATIVADDEAESFLRIEELHDALAFADDLRGHSPAAAEATASAAAESAAIAAVASATVAAAESAAVRPLAESAPILESAPVTVTVFSEEPVALVPAATAPIAFTPSVETHTG
jgi:hypothetical protein